MTDREEKVIVKRIAVNLNNPSSSKFEQIKDFLNIHSDTDVVRFLIGWFYREKLQKAKE